jgi:raffinose/stachyose/melibiose transport system substrate-binding protein
MKSRSLPARRATAVIVGLSLTALALTACSTSGGGSTASKSITVQAVHGDEAVVASYIKVFQKKNPGVKVKVTAVSQTGKNGSNIQVITSAGAPDVAMVPTNSQAYTQLAAGGQLTDIGDVWSASNLSKRLGAATADSLKIGGKPYVVPYEESLYNIVYYNKALFAKLGIQEPANHRISSFDDLKSIVAKLKAGGTQGLAIGPGDNYQASWMVDAFLPTSASPSQVTSFLTSWQGGKTAVSTKYTSPAFTDSINQIDQMGKAGIFQDGYLGQKVAQAESLFIQGQAGMLLDGDWSAATLKTGGISFDFGWALLPPVDSSKKAQLNTYGGNAFAIPVKAKNPELAKKFLEAVASVEGQTTLIKNGQLPMVNDVPAAAYTSLLPQVQEQLADFKANGGQPGWTSVVPGGLGQQLVDPLIQEMLNGNGTPASIGDAVQKQLLVVRAAK